MRVILLILIAVAIYYAHGALAANQGLVFRRDTITIVPVAEPEIKTEGKAEEKEGEKPKTPPTPRQPVAIKAEIRSEQTLRLDWVHTLKGLSGNTGTVILFDPPTKRPLVRVNMYSPVDVLFITADGKIIQIAPSLNLSELRDNVTAKEPVRAWLYLEAGAAERLQIKPGDMVNHPLFSPKPVILQ